jgi:calcineurin-like phosphoesterase family protein
MIYFTADTHFGHTAILKHCKPRKRVFGNLADMDEAIIDNINRVVGRNDTLYHIGDFCWQASRAGHYRQRINCRKIHVVRGNHDSSSLRKHVSSLEQEVFIKKYKLHLHHMPVISWQWLHYGGIHLYGHCHGTMEDQLNSIWPKRKAMDVGIDAIQKLTGQWRPISLDEVFSIVA